MEAEEKKFSLSQFLTEDNGDNSLQRERMKKLMREGIKHELTVRQRTCISMKFIDKMKAEEIADAKKYGLMDCIECGCCSYVCPANVRLVQRIRLGKGIVRTQMAEGAKATAKAANAAANTASSTTAPTGGAK